MLPASHRMRVPGEFQRAIRRGRRAGGRYLVVHLWAPPGQTSDAGSALATEGERTRVGLVVPRAVGNAVTRNQVKRRLRAQLALRIARFPPGSLVVVRAQPSAGALPSGGLVEALDRVLGRLLPSTAS
jgi:ribonuclease P protein component